MVSKRIMTLHKFLPGGRANHVSAQMAGKLCRDRHNFT